MCTILVVYHTQTGNTQRMAEAVAKGARSIENVHVVLKKAVDTGIDDLLQCHGIAFGSPEYFGYMAGMVKDFFDRTYESTRGRKEVFKKPYVAFISAGNDGAGALTSIERICRGYPLRKVQDPLIARGVIDEGVLAKCETLGKTIAAGCEAGIY